MLKTSKIHYLRTLKSVARLPENADRKALLIIMELIENSNKKNTAQLR